MSRRSRKAIIYIEATGLLLFKRLTSIFTEGDNTLPAAAPAAAAPATAATAAAALATLAALPDLEPDPIYNIIYYLLASCIRAFIIRSGTSICSIQSYAPNLRALNLYAPN
ncbi:hypothetical protein BT67DRAFT_434755 [Trichocladium antarcticum]|uniref:Uncharacterized protein n=1 Tax=Trichocladium antarcticum TaxID=1450529 RepID=A0AAN6UIW0_9PEZI|nr:hypothetical protein BT67DRAFT_434755 [Trichocladium antarcticum]